MILKTDKGAYFARYAGRPPDIKKLLPAEATVIDRLADDTLAIAKAIHGLIFKIQGYEPIDSEDITLPTVVLERRRSERKSKQ